MCPLYRTQRGQGQPASYTSRTSTDRWQRRVAAAHRALLAGPLESSSDIDAGATTNSWRRAFSDARVRVRWPGEVWRKTQEKENARTRGRHDGPSAITECLSLYQTWQVSWFAMRAGTTTCLFPRGIPLPSLTELRIFA